MPLITIEEISAAADSTWNAPQQARAALLLAGVLGWVKRHAPCLLEPNIDDGDAAEARMIISEAILRSVSAGSSNVASESVGPSSVGFVDRAALPTLTKADEASLRALCPSSAKPKNRFGTIRPRFGY